jgi:hypothetical protein
LNNYRFILEPYSSKKSRYPCPSCGKKNTFTRYIDLEKDEYLGLKVGICSRIQKCNYHYPPKDFFEDEKRISGISPGKLPKVLMTAALQKAKLHPNEDNLHPSLIEQDLFLQSLRETSENNFISFLEKALNKEAVIWLKNKYQIGTSKKWKGATIFWQIDQNNNVRTGKLMLYNKDTGKRSKINWVHSVLKIEDYNLKQCLFGLHLLNSDKTKAIAVVESEKTAIIASIAFPEFIWMATGGLTNLKSDVIQPLANRKVILFPDAGCYNKWSEKIKDLPKNIQFHMSELVEEKSSAEEKDEGWDIADYILKIYLGRKRDL